MRKVRKYPMTTSHASVLAVLSSLRDSTWQTAEEQSANGQHQLSTETAARATGIGQALAAVQALAVRTKRMTARGIQRMADRFAIYSPEDCQAADDRAASYDAVWGFSGDSTIAGFVDMERTRR